MPRSATTASPAASTAPSAATLPTSIMRRLQSAASTRSRAMVATTPSPATAPRSQFGNATSGVTITIGAGGAGSASGDGSVGTDTFTGGVYSAIGGNLADSYNASAFGAGLYNAFQGNGGNDTITGNGWTQAQFGNATSGVTITIGAGGAGSATGDGSVVPIPSPAASIARLAAISTTPTTHLRSEPGCTTHSRATVATIASPATAGRRSSTATRPTA